MAVVNAASSLKTTSEIQLSRLFDTDDSAVHLDPWKMNLVTTILEPYLWLCIATKEGTILIYDIDITQCVPDQENAQTPWTTYKHYPIGYCLVDDTINCIGSLSTSPDSSESTQISPLLIATSNSGKICVFDCDAIQSHIRKSKISNLVHCKPSVVIDNTEFIPNIPIDSDQDEWDEDYSVWSLDAIHCRTNPLNTMNSIHSKHGNPAKILNDSNGLNGSNHSNQSNQIKKSNDSIDSNPFFLAFGSNTHYLRVFKIHKSHQSQCQQFQDSQHSAHSLQSQTVKSEWTMSSLRNCRHSHNVPAVAFSNDGRYIATASIDGVLRIWRNSDFDTLYEHTSRMTVEEGAVCEYDEFQNGRQRLSLWRDQQSRPWLWSVLWIDPRSIMTIASKQDSKSDLKNESSDQLIGGTMASSSNSRMERLRRIGHKLHSLRSQMKMKKFRRNRADSNSINQQTEEMEVDIKTDDNEHNGDNEEIQSQNVHKMESPYIESICFDPSDESGGSADSEDDDLDDLKENANVDNVQKLENELMTNTLNTAANAMTSDVDEGGNLIAVCTATDLYILRMFQIVDDTDPMHIDYVMAEELSYGNVYQNIDRRYLKHSAADRLQFLRYIPKLSLIVCASTAYPCVAIMELYRDGSILGVTHHGFYPENWKDMNVECGKGLFLAGLDIAEVRCIDDPNVIDCHRIVLLYHSGLVSIVKVRKCSRSDGIIVSGKGTH